MKRNGPLAAYVCRDSLEETTQQQFKELLRDFNSYLYEACKLRSGYNDEITLTLGKLFKTINEASERESRWVPEISSAGWPQVNIDNTIVTSNYDMIMELYWRKIREPYADGFLALPGDPFIKEINFTTFSDKPNSKWLIKLHGSIWMYKCEKSIFKTIDDPQTSSIPVKIEEAMLIFPTTEKSVLGYPYYNFYNMFKMQQWSTLIVIGYSFRDAPINSAIIENLQRNLKSKVIVVDPRAENVSENLTTQGSLELGNRVIPVEGKLGEESTLLKLDLALRVRDRKRYQTRLQEIRLASLQPR